MTDAEKQEFTLFVQQYGPSLAKYCRLVSGQAGESEDLLQQALVRVLRNWAKARRAPVAYTKRTVLNLTRDNAKSPSKLIPMADVPVGTCFTSEGPAIVENSEILEVLRQLPVRQRLTLVMRVLEGQSESETAEILGCSRGTVKSNLSRGLANARQHLAKLRELEKSQ